MLGGRKFGTILHAAFERRHYRAARAALSAYERPITEISHYLLGSGRYPRQVTIRTNGTVVRPKIYSWHDLLTVNEIFCREDYGCDREIRTVVDFGSNIGLSALYFLTRNPHVRAYLYEPLPINVERLRNNLRGFEARFVLSEMAAGICNGVVQFGYEPTGRYGGVGLRRDAQIEVVCREANEILDELIARHGTIDVLKVDIESLEREVIAGLGDRAKRITTIFVEQQYSQNPLPTHRFTQYGTVAQFRPR